MILRRRRSANGYEGLHPGRRTWHAVAFARLGPPQGDGAGWRQAVAGTSSGTFQAAGHPRTDRQLALPPREDHQLLRGWYSVRRENHLLARAGAVGYLRRSKENGT